MQNIATIKLEEMEFYAYHGCYEQEQTVGNKFVVNIDMQVDAQKAAQSDDINDALNYVEVYNTVKDEMEIKSHLLENVTNRITESIFNKFEDISWLMVRVSKYSPPMGGQMKCVSLSMEKKRREDKL